MADSLIWCATCGTWFEYNMIMLMIFMLIWNQMAVGLVYTERNRNKNLLTLKLNKKWLWLVDTSTWGTRQLEFDHGSFCLLTAIQLFISLIVTKLVLSFLRYFDLFFDLFSTFSIDLWPFYFSYCNKTYFMIPAPQILRPDAKLETQRQNLEFYCIFFTAVKVFHCKL